jgi:hypothetical protein
MSAYSGHVYPLRRSFGADFGQDGIQDILPPVVFFDGENMPLCRGNVFVPERVLSIP